MQEETTIQFVRIVTSQKIDDRFLTAQAVGSEPDQKNVGTLFILVEITRPWFTISQIGTRIITTARKAYFNGDSTSDLVNFEKAVREVNEMLVGITEQGETEWIGNLNAVIALLVHKELHVSATGQAQAFLFREGKTSYITEASSDYEQNPIKTFSSIVSGSLLVNDTVLISNPQLKAYLGLPELKNCVDQHTPYEGTLNIVKSLKKNQLKTVNAIVFQITPRSQVVGEPDVIYLDQPIETFGQKTSRLWKKWLLPVLRVAGQFGKVHSQKAGRLAKEKIIPASRDAIKNVSQKTAEVLKRGYEKTRPIFQEKSKSIAAKLDNAITGIKSQPKEDLSSDPSISIIGKSIFTVHDYQQKIEVKGRSPFGRAIQGAIRLLTLLRLNVIRLAKLAVEKKRRPLMLALSVGALVAVLIASIAVQKNRQGDRQQLASAQTALQSAKKKLEDGKTALVFSDKDEAQILFGEAIAGAEPLVNSSFSTQANEILTAAQAEYDKLTGTSRYKDLEPIAKGFEGKGLTVIDGKGYTVVSGGKITAVNLGGGEPETVASLPEGESNPESVFQTADNKMIIATKTQSVYEFNPKDKSLAKLSPAGEEKFSRAGAGGSFGSSIYLLDPDNDQIWKYPRQGGEFKPVQKFLPRSQVELKGAIDIGIDGSIYVLFEDGKTLKLTKGEKENFSLGAVPKPFDKIKKAVKISANDEASSLFILDAGAHRLLEFDKNGQFSHQYVFPAEFSDLKELVVQFKSRRGFVVNGDKLYEVGL